MSQWNMSYSEELQDWYSRDNCGLFLYIKTSNINLCFLFLFAELLKPFQFPCVWKGQISFKNIFLIKMKNTEGCYQCKICLLPVIVPKNVSIPKFVCTLYYLFPAWWFRRCSLPLRMFSSYSVSWQLKGTVMRRAENNTGLATLQQEPDKFNEDRQGNKEKKKEGKKDKKPEEQHGNSQMASPTNVGKTEACPPHIKGLVGDSVGMVSQHNDLPQKWLWTAAPLQCLPGLSGFRVDFDWRLNKFVREQQVDLAGRHVDYLDQYPILCRAHLFYCLHTKNGAKYQTKNQQYQ